MNEADDPPTVDELIDAGEHALDEEQYPIALANFRGAWNALPDPAGDDRAVSILTAVADCHFFLKEWQACHDAMQEALRHGAGPDNTFIRLRLGQSLYELGNETEAANWLVPVYLMEGREPFDEDFKYLDFFRPKLDPPPAGWPDGW